MFPKSIKHRTSVNSLDLYCTRGSVVTKCLWSRPMLISSLGLYILAGRLYQPIHCSMDSWPVRVQCMFDYFFPCVSVLRLSFQFMYIYVAPFLYIFQPFFAACICKHKLNLCRQSMHTQWHVGAEVADSSLSTLVWIAFQAYGFTSVVHGGSVQEGISPSVCQPGRLYIY